MNPKNLKELEKQLINQTETNRERLDRLFVFKCVVTLIKDRIEKQALNCVKECGMDYADCDVSENWDCDESVIIKELKSLLGDDAND